MKKKFFLGLCLTTSVITSLTVYFDSVTILSLLLYIISITSCFIYLVGKNPLSARVELNRKTFFLIIGLTLLQLVLLQYFSNFPLHYIQDEFISAYTSFDLPSLNELSWFSVFPNKDEWFAQFPMLFFVLQKPFLVFLGPSLDSIRLSTWPYHVLIIIYLYLLAKEYFSNRILIFSTLIIYVFLAPNLYLSSLGTHFVSSALFFLASFYYFILTIKQQKRRYAVLCGLFVGLGYLTYTASYISLPILFLFAAIESVKLKLTKVLKLFAPTIIIFLIMMAPFLIYALTKDNFFLQRIDQVNTFKQENFISQTSHQFITNIQALYTDGTGGVNNYWFGKKSLFNKLTFSIILIGLFASFKQFYLQKKYHYLYLLFAILLTFLFGMVFTVPPGAFHRVFIAFPFIAILITEALRYITGVASSWTNNIKFKYVFLGMFLLVFIGTNFNDASEMIRNDEFVTTDLHDSIYIASFITAHVEREKTIFIAAFPAYHLQKELFFRTAGNYKFVTNYFPSALSFAKNNMLIIHYPTDKSNQKLIQQLPDGIILNTINGYMLRQHAIFIPN